MKFFKSLPKQKLQQLILVIIVSLVAVGAVGYYFIGTELTNISEQQERLTKLSADVSDTEKRIKAEAASEGLREQMKAFVAEQQRRMVTGDPFSWVVREINLLGEKYGMRDLGLSPSGVVPGPNFQLYITSINFQGGYDEIGGFVKDLENQFPLSQIRSISVSPGGSDASHGCRATLELALAVHPADTVKHPAKPDTTKSAKKAGVKKS